MLELQGLAVSPGVAIGHVHVFDREGYRIAHCQIDARDHQREIGRFRDAIVAAKRRVEAEQQDALLLQNAELGGIFSAHLQMILDPSLHSEIEAHIESRNYSAEFAVSEVLNRFAEAFRRIGSPYMAEKVADVLDIERILLEMLTGQEARTLNDLDRPVIIASHDLTPGETAKLDPTKVIGFCTEVGGIGGHTAIVARGLEIPAIVGVGEFLYRIPHDAVVIIDGYRGRILIEPDDETREFYIKKKEQREILNAELRENRDLPACTSDNEDVQLLCNIEFPQEVELAKNRGGSGVGLYRTEFLYLNAVGEPSEEEHFKAYRHVVESMHGQPVIIRTLDLGADKMWQKNASHVEANPFLGLRSIRLSLRNPALFRTQIRAILRAAVFGDLRLMFPMVTTLDELRSARFILRSVGEDLVEEGIAANLDIPVGVMVEVPATVVMLDHFAEEIDFISIGTNDLTQYTLAVDRSNESVADLYQACDPSVLRLIRKCVEVAENHTLSLSVCGEMSSNPAHALLLIGLGVRTLSMPPSTIPNVKNAIRSVSLHECEAMAWRAMRLGTAREVDKFLNNQMAGLLPEVFAQL